MTFVKYTRQFASDYSEQTTLSMQPKHTGAALTHVFSFADRQWEDIWHEEEYENEYYYVSQLFEQNWQPRTM